MKKISLLFLALATLFSLTACGEVTKESVIEDCLDYISGADNVHCATVTSLDMKIGENQVTSSLAMDADMDIENGLSHMKMHSISNGEELAVEFYVDSNETPAKYYIGSGERWLKMNPDEMPQVDASADLHRDFEAYFDELMINPETTMEVTDIDGEECFVLSAPVNIRSLQMARTFSIDGFLSNFLGEDASEDTLSTMVSYLGPISITIYIRCDDYAPFGMVMDLKPSLEAMYLKLNATDVVINEAYASSAYSDYDDSEVEIPEKVRFAPDSSSISGSNN